MTKRFTITLGICAAAAAVTAGALFAQPSSSPVAAPAAPAATVAGADPAAIAAPVAAAAGATLTIEGFKFSGSPVAAGATVEVVNLDGAPHTVSGDAFDVGVGGGASASFTAPAAPGTYSYVCQVHPSMKGELVVQ